MVQKLFKILDSTHLNPFSPLLMSPMTRLILLVILFLLSLLSIFPAPTYHLWLTAILVTEYPLLFIFPGLVLLLAGKRSAQYRIAGTVAGMSALILFTSPIIKAYFTANTLATELPDKQRLENHPFNLAKLLSRGNTKEVSYREFTYNKTGNKRLNLKFFSSYSKGVKPCIVVIHGGSWKSGDNNQLPELNSYLASEGYHVAAINYHLAPQYRSPTPVEDVKHTMKFLKEHSAHLAIDTGQFVLLGRSAGAQIALLAAYTLNDPGIKAVVDFYGPADMVWGYSLPANPLVMNSRKVMEDYLGGTYKQIPFKYQKSSPILFVNKNSVPTLIIHGENDVLVAYEHSTRLYKKLRENNVYTYFLSLPWATHGFDFNINGPGGQLSTYAVGSFLKKVCK